MKAIVCERYGPPEVLQLKEVDTPAPRNNELRVKVHATAVTSGDRKIRSFEGVPASIWLPGRLALGLTKPKRTIPGIQFAGEVESVGKSVTLFRPGDPVYGCSGMNLGAYAQFLCVPERGAVTRKPANLTFDEAAAVPFGAVASLCFLKEKANIQPGQSVLIIGASGDLGLFAVQLAKHFGASVTGVCGTASQALVKSLGADAVLDYTKDDFTKNGKTYDIIYDTVGKSSFPRCKRSLTPTGLYLAALFGLPGLLHMLWTSLAGGRKIICALAIDRAQELAYLRDLIESGAIKPVIDKRYPLDQAAEAHRYADSGAKKGSIILTIAHAP